MFYVIRYQDQSAKLWSFPQQYGDAEYRRVQETERRMAAVTLVDLLMQNMSSRIEYMKQVYLGNRL